VSITGDLREIKTLSKSVGARSRQVGMVCDVGGRTGPSPRERAWTLANETRTETMMAARRGASEQNGQGSMHCLADLASARLARRAATAIFLFSDHTCGNFRGSSERGTVVQDQAELSRCKIYEGAAAHQRLAQFGLKAKYFAEAATAGHDKRSQVLAVHPAAFGGWTMWGETLAALRTRCLDLNQSWEIGRGYETILNAPRHLAMAVVGGDVNTGVQGFKPPKTARPRGPETESRVDQNRNQLTLAFEGFVDAEDDTNAKWSTWFFMLNARDKKLYSELSLPIAMGDSQRISQWAERILFTPLNLAGAITPITPVNSSQGQAHVSVTRKQPQSDV
jgi:hypothetical protein